MDVGNIGVGNIVSLWIWRQQPHNRPSLILLPPLGTVNQTRVAPWCDVQLRTFKLSAQILEMRWCSSKIDGCHLACRARLISYERPSVRIRLPIILL